MLGAFDQQGFLANFQNARNATTNRKVGEALKGGNIQGASQIAFDRGANDVGVQLQQAYQKQIATASKEQKAQADQRLKQLGGLASALSKVPAEQRLQVIQNVPQFQQTLSTLQIDPRQLTAEHLNDGTLTAIQGLAQGADQFNSDSLAVRKQDETERSALVGEDQSQQGIDLNVRKQDFEEGDKFGLAERQENRLDATLDETKRSNRASEGIKRSANEIAQIKAKADGGNGINFDDEQKLRKEFASVEKDFPKVRDAFARIQASAADPSAAGDLALIFNYMKVLDPGSTVREGEFATAQNAAGVDERTRALYKRISTGERLTPVQRKDFVNRAGRLYQEQEQSYQTTVDNYRGLAQEYSLSPDRVVPETRQLEVSDTQNAVQEGATATNPQTGEKIMFQNGQWVAAR